MATFKLAVGLAEAHPTTSLQSFANLFLNDEYQIRGIPSKEILSFNSDIEEERQSCSRIIGEEPT